MVYKLLFTIFLINYAAVASAENVNLCNPLVKLDVEDVQLSKLVIDLAEKHQFDTSFPAIMDKKITIRESGSLEDLLKSLTKGMSTILRKQYQNDCDGEAIIELYFLPTGQKTEYVKPSEINSGKVINYIYIDDMAKYTEDVISGERQQKKRQLTPEQKKEFQMMKKKLRKNNKDLKEEY